MFSKVAHGRCKLGSENKMLQELDQFNKYIFMKGFEKTQLIRNLELKLQDFIRHAKYELGMHSLSYKVNVPMADDSKGRTSRLNSIGSVASQLASDLEKTRFEKVKEKDRKMNAWMIGSSIYDMSMDLLMCKKLFRLRTSLIQIYQKVLEKDQQEQYFCYLLGEREG